MSQGVGSQVLHSSPLTLTRHATDNQATTHNQAKSRPETRRRLCPPGHTPGLATITVYHVSIEYSEWQEGPGTPVV
eukprot:scaffold105553_cov60-Phaeocystis_antarctica.AAC.2